MSRLLNALRSGRVLLMDGAMGTELLRAGRSPTECGELWNLTNPEPIQAIHEAYVKAGAECLVTNTFQANPYVLTKHGLGPRLEEIYRASLALARSANTDGFVMADVGPLPPEMGRDQDAHTAWLKRVLRAAGDADSLLLETYSAWMAPIALKPLQNASRPPLFVSFAFKRISAEVFLTEDGLDPETVADWGESQPIDALGVNCGLDIDMDAIRSIIRRYRQRTSLPLFARPNAGTPHRERDQWIYPHTPESMTAGLRGVIEAGVAMVGGCCGTTPAHIAAFRPLIRGT